MTTYELWARTAAGLESMLVDELSEKIGLKQFETLHKGVLFNTITPTKRDRLAEIKIADDIFEYLGSCKGIDNKKSSSEKIVAHFKQKVIPALRNRGSDYVRITLSFLGQRNFNRYFIENLLKEIVVLESDYKVLSNEGADPWKQGEVRVRYHVEGEIAYCGIALSDKPLHRRSWRTAAYSGQLHPPIAAAMARTIGPQKENIIIDPFCGSGTLLVESALHNPSSIHFGFDIDSEAINAAKASSDNAGTSIKFFQEDFFSLKESYNNFKIISNPPWGLKHSQGENLEQEVFIEKFLQLLLASTGAILLVPADFIAVMKGAGIFFREVAQTRVKGKLASIVVWTPLT